MSSLYSLLNDAAPFDVWMAARMDGLRGTGSASDPWNTTALRTVPLNVSLQRGLSDGPDRQATATTAAPHGLQDGDLVEIINAENSPEAWNGLFTVYDVQLLSFKYLMFRRPAGVSASSALFSVVRCLFDEIMRQTPAQMKIHIGPGVFYTRGFASGDPRGWSPKSGQVISGMGSDVTSLRLIGAVMSDEHYHVIGTPINDPAAALQDVEVMDLTLDCNLDEQSGKLTPGYADLACGGVRLLGQHAAIRRVKVINWGTKSVKQGCFAISLIHGLAQSNSGPPTVASFGENTIEDCIVIQPSKNNAREATALHIGGSKDIDGNPQPFGRNAVVRRNFVDCAFLQTFNENVPVNTIVAAKWFSSAFVTGAVGTVINGDTGTFVGRREHFRTGNDVNSFLRFYNPRNPNSRWNGYFRITLLDVANTIAVNLGTDTGRDDDSNFVIMGTEFRGIAVDSCIHAVVEQNQIHNCWIGGPYCSPLDEISTLPVVPSLEDEERNDPLTGLHIKSLTVRDNIYRDVGVGPYLNMGGVTGNLPSTGNVLSFNSSTGEATMTMGGSPQRKHYLWPGARIQVIDAPATAYVGIHEVVYVTDTTFRFKLPPGTPALASGFGSYGVVCGSDFLVIEYNQIMLMNLDKDEFAIKEYPLGVLADRRYRAHGIIVADNERSPAAGPFTHQLVIVRGNKIGYVDHETGPTLAGIGAPAGLGMILAGIKQLHVTNNLLHLNPRHRSRTFRCGKVRFSNNSEWDGVVFPGVNGDTGEIYREPETDLEDAFILGFINHH